MERRLPTGYISVQDAVELIKKDTRDNPIVDMDWLIARKKRIEVGHTFRIPRVRMLPPEKVKRSRFGKVIDYEVVKSEYVFISDAFEQELLKKTIGDKYAEMVGHEYRELGLKSRSTVSNDATSASVQAVRPRNIKPIAKAGTSIGIGSELTSNGEGIEV